MISHRFKFGENFVARVYGVLSKHALSRQAQTRGHTGPIPPTYHLTLPYLTYLIPYLR